MLKFSFTRCARWTLADFLLLVIMGITLVANSIAMSHIKSRLNHADGAALLRECTRDAFQRDTYAASPDEPLVPSFWLVSLRSGSSAAEVEVWADSHPGSSLYIGHQIVVQSHHDLRARMNALSPAISIQPFPVSLKLSAKDASHVCRASSPPSSLHTVHLIVRIAGTSAVTFEKKLPIALRTSARILSATPTSASTHLVSLTMSVSSQQSALAAHWLISQPSTMFVQLRPTFSTQNNNAAWQLQSGMPFAVPVWQHGLRGEGQLISVGDTGIHPNSCFFSPLLSFERGAVESTIRRSAVAGSCTLIPQLNLSAISPHPKLHAYLRYTSTDFSDTPGGHGTHVCGSACGSSSNPELSPFNGMAPSSKLVFIDLANVDDLIVPDDLNSDYFPCVYAAGARISSNSWGSSENIYDLYASSLDSFVHAHDDLLVLVAAGNDGTKGEYTVGTPATAKNMLAVGAVTSAITTDCQKCTLNPNSVFFSVENSSNVYFIPAAFSADVCSLSPPLWPRRIALYRPPPQEDDGCKSFAVDTCGQMSGKAVVLSRGVCLFVEKSLRAIACGASVVIIVNVNSDNPILMDGQGQVRSTPVFSAGRQFFSVLQPITGPYINFSAFSSRVVASFSSLGPTADGRTKPDVVAPGSPIYSSNALDSPNSCTASGVCPSSSSPRNVAAKSGTSMATPLLAGTAALIRQYLAEGFYPGGFRGSGISVNPSAALMRALMIGSSRSTLPLRQTQRSMSPFSQDETPSFAQGWGAPVASAILPFANSTFSRSFSIKLIDRWPLEQSGSLSAQFRVVNDDSPLTVTLAWTDPPSLPASDFRGMLVNDVDLYVVSPQGTLYAGNGFWSIQIAPSTVRVPLLDTVNNQEQVHVPRAQAGVWGVHVRASRLSSSAQQVAVVIAGEGNHWPGAAPDRCSMWCKGTCTSAQICLCSGSQWGAACDGVVVDMPLQGVFGSYSEDVSLDVGGWRYYRFTPSIVGSTLDIYMFSTSGDPDVFVSSDDSIVPDLLTNQVKDQRCDTCGQDHPYEECDPCVDEICSGKSQGCFTMNRIETSHAVIIGVHVSCCIPSSFTIKFTCQSSQAIVLIVVGVIVALVAVFFIWKKRERIVIFSRAVVARWTRSTTRPRFPNFRNAFNFRQARVAVSFLQQTPDTI